VFNTQEQRLFKETLKHKDMSNGRNKLAFWLSVVALAVSIPSLIRENILITQ